MNPNIEKLFHDAEGRYLEPTEQSALTTFANGLERRLEAMRAIEQAESDIISTTVDAMFEEFPDMKKRHQAAHEKAIRDMTLVLRYSAMAMVRDSEEFLTQKVLFWFRTIIDAFEMNKALDFAYGRLIEESQNKLAKKDFELLEPYLQLVHNALKPN